MHDKLLSIIIPTLNEANYIGSCIESIICAGFKGPIILVDAKSTDATLAIASDFEQVEIVVSEKRGRAAQMNLGARMAQSEYLLFLHADSIFPAEAFNFLMPNMRSRAFMAGSFSLQFDDSGFFYRLLEKLSQINHPLATYGDQGLLVHRKVFFDLGGFKDWPLLEDLEMVQRITRNYPFKKLPFALQTSTRRFQKNGPLRQTIINFSIVTAYLVGYTPQFLKQFYY